jgi:hypothetical protein
VYASAMSFFNPSALPMSFLSNLSSLYKFLTS